MTIDEAYEVLDCLGQLAHDPEAFVWFAFDWENDPELQGKQPQKWQLEQLRKIGKGLEAPNEVIRQAVASGHGIGKSTLVAWLILWAISTYPDTRGVVTANTETQLRTKTWPELSKWYYRFIGKELFCLTATSLFSIQQGHERTWRIDAIPWSPINTEAFAGLHNQGNRILLVFDEASAIDDRDLGSIGRGHDGCRYGDYMDGVREPDAKYGAVSRLLLQTAQSLGYRKNRQPQRTYFQ